MNLITVENKSYLISCRDLAKHSLPRSLRNLYPPRQPSLAYLPSDIFPRTRIREKNTDQTRFREFDGSDSASFSDLTSVDYYCRARRNRLSRACRENNYYPPYRDFNTGRADKQRRESHRGNISCGTKDRFVRSLFLTDTQYIIHL